MPSFLMFDAIKKNSLGGRRVERNEFYSSIPKHLLGAFYIYISKNIEKGIKIKKMRTELGIIEKEVSKRRMTISELIKEGESFIQLKVLK